MASTYLKSIVIVGASGNVGSSLLKHLLAINPTIQITLVSRTDSDATFPASPQIVVKKGSYEDSDFLEKTFAGHDAALFALSLAGTGIQTQLIEAAAKAGVKWIFPNEWAGDGNHPTLFQEVPLYAPKLAARRQIDELAKTYTGLKWVAIATNPWTELSIQAGFFGIDVPNRSVTLKDGSGPFNSSSMSRVGEGIAKVLSLPIANKNDARKSLEHYANDYVYVSSYSVTQEQLFEAVKKATGTKDEDWTIQHADIREGIAVDRKKFEEGDFWAGASLTYGYYMGKGLGGDWEEKSKVDRQVLGLELESLDEVVKGALV